MLSRPACVVAVARVVPLLAAVEGAGRCLRCRGVATPSDLAPCSVVKSHPVKVQATHCRLQLGGVEGGVAFTP